MEETKNNQSAKKNDDCPLCKVSEETIERLKMEQKKILKDKEPTGTNKKKSPFNLTVWLIFFIIFLGVFAFYQFSSKQPGKMAKTLNLTKTAGILETLPRALGVGKAAPGFNVQTVEGNQVSLDDFRGKKPVLLVFWATWCGFCAQELGDMKKFTEKYQDKIQVLALTGGESREAVKNYIQKENVNFLMALDEKKDVWNKYSIRGTPSHFLIDKNGDMASLRFGLSLINDLEIMLTMLK